MTNLPRFTINIDTHPFIIEQAKESLEKNKKNLESHTSELTMEIQSLQEKKQEQDRKLKTLETQLTEANIRLTDDETKVSELQDIKLKLSKEVEVTVAQVEQFESKCSQLERANKTLEEQLTETQVIYKILNC